MKTFYQIDGVNEEFRTLQAAKHHVYIAYTDEERIKYLSGTSITKICNEEAVTMTPINIDRFGNYSFGRTVKL